MVFHSLTLTDEGVISAVAEGHPTDVVAAFHDVCEVLLTRRGAWRITDVKGSCGDNERLDSKMEWSLIAKLKH